MKYVASIVIDGVEEAAVVVNMFDRHNNETIAIDKALSCVVRCSQGFIHLDPDTVPIHTVQ